MESLSRRTSPRLRGYTLIEMLVVMGIILLMLTLVLLSVASMLKSSRMSRAVGLLVAAVDEARTAAITIRRSTKVDLTRVDTAGWYSRLTVVGPFFNENFESYALPGSGGVPPPAGSVVPKSAMWITSAPTEPMVELDGSRCLKMLANQSYWNVGNRVDTIARDDFEMNVQARVKFVPGVGRTPGSIRTIRILNGIKDSGTSISDCYRLNLSITADAAGRNKTSSITIDRQTNPGALSVTAPAKLAEVVDTTVSVPSPTTALVEGVWYRVILSVKLMTDPTTGRSVRVAGKVWADGQLEPWGWTVGPATEGAAALDNGTGGFSTQNCEGYADDVLFDVRPIRVIPQGLRMDAMYCKVIPMTETESDWAVAPEANAYNFPILFRPDGTAAEQYVIRITDISSAGDKRYVTVDQNTGRARLVHSLKEAIKR